MNLVTSGTTGKQILICGQDEYEWADELRDKLVNLLAGGGLELAQACGLYKEAYKLFDKLESVRLELEQKRWV